ncbi:Clavaminate synthase-like protein [Hesseltinella vesiculosa]|uniref:Clavaminate synthase-like protein n=1 Tax=Hesseltinella vesiculosa TaxID=101127 RepID=A0A1X2GTM8_9FUNG|nr:Clavaminate synthase-like protein [Hesseltinella vesiculosa]
MVDKAAIENAFVKFIKDYQDINGSDLFELDRAPTPLEFLQTCVLRNRPCLIRNAFNHWPARKTWTDEYLIRAMNGQNITVAVTPNGYADAVTLNPTTNKEYFVLPHEEQMTMDAFLKSLHASRCPDRDGALPPAYYISLQNGSLPLEYSQIAKDVDAEIPWCSEALQASPDAINFWFGNDRSITSLHKDPYENLYAVVRGSKTFILFPPSEFACMYESVYPAAQYQPNDQHGFDIVPQPNIKVPWIPVNPLQPDLKRYPRFKHAKPIIATVNEGEMLYLPALWFHQVLQQGEQGTIAVNYWYDMKMDTMLYPSIGLFRRLISNLVDAQPDLDLPDSDTDESPDRPS